LCEKRMGKIPRRCRGCKR